MNHHLFRRIAHRTIDSPIPDIFVFSQLSHSFSFLIFPFNATPNYAVTILHKSFAFPISSFPLRLNPVPPQSRSLQCYSVAIHSLSNRYFASTLLLFAFPFHYLSLRLRSNTLLFMSLSSPIYRTSRLSRSCCSPVSDSLVVFNSHRGNLCSRC